MDTFGKADTTSTIAADTPTPRPSRHYTDEFKAQTVRLVLDEGKSLSAVARDLDLTVLALRLWVEQTRADTPHRSLLSGSRAARTRSPVVVLVSCPMFSVANRMSKSKRANKRAKRMRVYAGAEMNT